MPGTPERVTHDRPPGQVALLAEPWALGGSAVGRSLGMVGARQAINVLVTRHRE